MVIDKFHECVSLDQFLRISREVAISQGFEVSNDEITRLPEKYRLGEERSRDHEYGYGGHNLHAGRLFRGNNLVLELKNLLEWGTTSDDSMDHTTTEERYTSLLEDDNLGRRIFAELETEAKKYMIGIPEQGMSIPDFKTPSQRVAPFFVNIIGFYELMKMNNFTDMLSMKDCSGLEFDLRIKSEVDWQHPVDTRFKRQIETDECRGFRLQGKYRIIELDYSKHEEGVGGENVVNSFLMKYRTPVLMSSQHLTYDTSSGDEDRQTSVTQRTELLDEKNLVAAKLFYDIKKSGGARCQELKE